MSDGSAAAPGRKSRTGIVDVLNQEWVMLVRAHRRAVSRWGAAHGALTGCESLNEVLQRATKDPDAVLAALLTEVANADQLAARTVFQSMLGRIVRMASRDYRAGVDDYLSALWCVITSYPLERRPARIPANLSMETLKLVTSERRWLLSGEVSPWPPSGFLDLEFEPDQLRRAVHEIDAVDVLGVGVELRLIDRRAAALLHSVYVDGLSSSEAGEAYRTSAGAIRVRCSKAVRQLADHALELAGAA